MNNEYPLYPELSEVGKEEAQKLVDAFKKELKKAADIAISDLYCDILPHIESDSWTNMREQLLAGLCDYGNRFKQGQYDFAKIRRTIFDKFRDEIIKDLNQDLVKENESLRSELKEERRWRSMA